MGLMGGISMSSSSLSTSMRSDSTLLISLLAVLYFFSDMHSVVGEGAASSGLDGIALCCNVLSAPLTARCPHLGRRKGRCPGLLGNALLA